MIQILFGVLDLITGGYLLGSLFFNLSNYFLIIFGTIIFIKGFLFIKYLDVASILDILSGILIILSVFFAMGEILKIIISIYLIQKGIFSFRFW